MDKENLFNEFPPVTTQQWEDVIKKDLKGADYEKKLIWKTNEGIKVKPYYRAEDLEKITYLITNPGEFPYNRGNKVEGNNWEIQHDIIVTDISKANKEALEALGSGATAIGFIVNDKINTSADFFNLIKDIRIDSIHFNLIDAENPLKLIDFINEEINNKSYNSSSMEGFVSFNPMGVLTKSGNWQSDVQSDFEMAKAMIKNAKSHLPGYRVLAANGCMFQESGATIVQAVAFTLAIANEYLSRLTEMGLSIDEIASRIRFNFTIGSNYFMEIAKIRAFRLLWSNIVMAYNPKSKDVAKAFVHCTPTKWNMTIYDPYVNMLRTATESMSAVIGGADSISARPFDAPFKKAGSFSNRIARNIQIILKEEAYFDRIADPAAGSYYIENLTDSIATEVWKLFLLIEENGGYCNAFKKGFIQSEIETIANKRLNDIATHREILLGTNQYPNFNEQMLHNIEPDVIFEKQKISDKKIARPIKKFRGARDFEELRLKTEKSGRRPKVFMLTVGSLSMRLARSQFSSNFFACAGFEVIDNNGFNTVDEGIVAALAINADIIVLCSSDEEYAKFAYEAFKILNNKAIFVIAGNPACQPELENKGIKNFISVRSNILETLKYYQKELKIE